MKQAIIIFVRKPELGKVKTRLAASVGQEKALEIYKELLQHTHNAVLNVAADKFIFYTEAAEENDLWSEKDFIKKTQAFGDLGHKMKTAFAEVFVAGYEKVVIIGSDCLQLTEEIIIEAFEKLSTHEAVIGPANDGGYYLLGMKKLLPFLFENIEWSTEQVYSQTTDSLLQRNISFATLITLIDIDTEEDWLQTKM